MPPPPVLTSPDARALIATTAPAAGRRGAVRLVGVGHVALDHVWDVQAVPAHGLKTPAHGYRCVVGGMTANASVAAARLGAMVRIVAPVGDDTAWPVFAAHFAREGIDAGGLLRVPGASSSTTAVMVDAAGERTIVNHRGTALHAAPAFDAAALAGADGLLADPRCVAWAEAALRAARARGLLSVLDADTSPQEDLQRLAGLAEWTVFSDPGRQAYLGPSGGTPQDALARALAAGARVAVATHGAQGLWWQRAGLAPAHLPAFAVAPVVDTLGAGDVFHGALGVALAEGQGDLAALRFASAAAGLKCLQPGGACGAPRREAVMALLAAQPLAAT